MVSVLLLAGCAHQGTITTGGGTNAGTMMSGSAGGAASVNANKSLTRCTSTLGTLAVDDGTFRGDGKITTIDPLIRLAIQQSNCFVITSIGNEKTSSKIDRFLDKQRNSGEYRTGSKQQKGQRVAADYFLEPQIVINNETTGGSGAAFGAALGAVNPLAGALGANTVDKTTEVALTLTDIRSTVQIAAAQGTASTSNYAAGGGIGGILGSFAGAVGMGSFTRTPEGQATAAAFFDAYNQMVDAVRNYQAQDVKGGLGRFRARWTS